VLNPAEITDEIVEIRLKIYSRPKIRDSIHVIVGKGMEPEAQEPFMLTKELLATLKQRTLVIWSREDPLCPWQVAKEFQQLILHSQFELLENCGHWPQFEQADAFNRAAVEFLTGK
jgi:2-hydroxy-6-oxonona-2,4-dienedioate hydrolase